MDTIWINVILTGIIAASAVANLWCTWRMSKTAKQQYLDNKPIYMYEDNVLFGIIRLGNIVGFDTNNGIKKSVGFFLYIKGDIPFHYDIKLRSEKDTPEKYFLDIVDGKVDKIHTNLSLL